MTLTKSCNCIFVHILFIVFHSSSSVQLLSHVRLFAIPWTAHVRLPCPSPTPGACLKLMSIELVMSSNHHIHYCPLSSCLQSFPASGSFLKSQFFSSDGQSIGASASASVLPMNFQDLFPLGLTYLIILLSKRLSLGRPRGIWWRGRWEGGLGWRIHVYPWLLHVNIWQKPLQYCKVISHQLIKKNKNKFNKKSLLQHHNSKTSILQYSAFFMV